MNEFYVLYVSDSCLFTLVPHVEKETWERTRTSKILIMMTRVSFQTLLMVLVKVMVMVMDMEDTLLHLRATHQQEVTPSGLSTSRRVPASGLSTSWRIPPLRLSTGCLSQCTSWCIPFRARCLRRNACRWCCSYDSCIGGSPPVSRFLRCSWWLRCSWRLWCLWCSWWWPSWEIQAQEAWKIQAR